MTEGDTSRIEAFRFLVLGAQREGNRKLAAALAELGITPSQGEILGQLLEHQPMTVVDLGRRLVCEAGENPSRLVKRLVDLGLLHRERDEHDARAWSLTLTERGLAVARKADGIQRAFERSFAEHLDPADLEVVNRVLAAVVAGTDAGTALANRSLLPSPKQTPED